MTNSQTTAWIYSAELGGLEETDLVALSHDRLRALRVEAGTAGDTDLVAIIDGILS